MRKSGTKMRSRSSAGAILAGRLASRTDGRNGSLSGQKIPNDRPAGPRHSRRSGIFRSPRRRLGIALTGGSLARSHGTRYPIVQGPMTRVSDVAPFALAVAKSGGLPMLALALMRGPQVKGLLCECKNLMGGFSWGVGILGFVPPTCARSNWRLSVKSGLHSRSSRVAVPNMPRNWKTRELPHICMLPTPQLLELFVGRGSRRFIFEGRECGGHVGPLSSFCLWESMIEKLLEVPEKAAPEIHVLFAGGIHDGRTGAMIGALATPLARRGMKIGVLMGAAYLFTSEAVNCGAIVPKFQEEALKCTRTINLETGPRPRFAVHRYSLCKGILRNPPRAQSEKMERQEISQTLDSLTLGRLRVASKGLMRKEDNLVSVNESEQFNYGMYMIGQAATLRESLVPLEELHRDVSEGSVRDPRRSEPDRRAGKQPAHLLRTSPSWA